MVIINRQIKKKKKKKKKKRLKTGSSSSLTFKSNSLYIIGEYNAYLKCLPRNPLMTAFACLMASDLCDWSNTNQSMASIFSKSSCKQKWRKNAEDHLKYQSKILEVNKF